MDLICVASERAGHARTELEKRFHEMKDAQQKALLEFQTDLRSRERFDNRKHDKRNHTQKKVIHIQVHIPRTNAETPKREEEVLIKEIQSMTKDFTKHDAFQFLKLTMAKRKADQEEMSVRLRFENLRENKIFLNSNKSSKESTQDLIEKINNCLQIRNVHMD
ncbi:unnamed protein product [Mytilus edulis]|uniref:Uncharacterized protein n=1 Tax=Mytilus edulis TaxID=6550 RepID=A0A8S3TBN7_MYTED|nr:unnamed protein product [Mytilus edulis]